MVRWLWICRMEFLIRTMFISEHVNNNNNTGSSLPFNVILAPSPNLKVLSVNTPDTLSNREKTYIQWQVINEGLSVAEAPWRDQIYLSTHHEFHPDSVIILGNKKRSGNLSNAVNPIYNASSLTTLPNDLDVGYYYLYVQTDYQNSVYESIFETDNITRSDSFYIANPDLKIEMNFG